MVMSPRIGKRTVRQRRVNFVQLLRVQIVKLIRKFIAQNFLRLGHCNMNNFGIVDELSQKKFAFALRNIATYNNFVQSRKKIFQYRITLGNDIPRNFEIVPTKIFPTLGAEVQRIAADTEIPALDNNLVIDNQIL